MSAAWRPVNSSLFFMDDKTGFAFGFFDVRTTGQLVAVSEAVIVSGFLGVDSGMSAGFRAVRFDKGSLDPFSCCSSTSCFFFVFLFSARLRTMHSSR